MRKIFKLQKMKKIFMMPVVMAAQNCRYVKLERPCEEQNEKVGEVKVRIYPNEMQIHDIEVDSGRKPVSTTDSWLIEPSSLSGISLIVVKNCASFNGHYLLELTSQDILFQLHNVYAERTEPQVFDTTIIDVNPSILNYYETAKDQNYYESQRIGTQKINVQLEGADYRKPHVCQFNNGVRLQAVIKPNLVAQCNINQKEIQKLKGMNQIYLSIVEINQNYHSNFYTIVVRKFQPIGGFEPKIVHFNPFGEYEILPYQKQVFKFFTEAPQLWIKFNKLNSQLFIADGNILSVDLGNMHFTREEWNSNIPVFYSFNSVDFFKLEHDLRVVPDLVIESVIFSSNFYEIQVLNSNKDALYYCDLATKLTRAILFSKDFIVCEGPFQPQISIVTNEGHQTYTSKVLDMQPKSIAKAQSVVQKNLLSLSVNLGPQIFPDDLHRVLIDGDSQLYFELSEKIPNSHCLFQENESEWISELSWVYENTYTCQFLTYDIELIKPVTVEIVVDNVRVLKPLKYAREVAKVLPIPVLLYKVQSFQSIRLLPQIDFRFIDGNSDLNITLQPNVKNQLLQLISSQFLRCVVNEYFVYEAKMMENNEQIFCMGALDHIEHSQNLTFSKISLEINGEPILGEMISYFLPDLDKIHLPNSLSILDEYLDLEANHLITSDLAQTGQFNCQFNSSQTSAITKDLKCRVPPFYGQGCNSIQVAIIVLNKMINIENSFMVCPSKPQITDIYPQIFVHQGQDYNQSIRFEFRTPIVADKYACQVNYDFAEGFEENYPFDGQNCQIRVSSTFGQFRSIFIRLIQGNQTIAAIQQGEPLFPVILFNTQIDLLGDKRQFYPHGLNNTLIFQLKIDKIVKQKLIGKGVRIFAQLSDKNLGQQSMIEASLNLDTVFETPSYEFSLQDLRVIDRNQKRLSLQFYLDFSASGIVDRNFIEFVNSSYSFEVLPWFPVLKKKQLIGIRQENKNVNISFEFMDEIPHRIDQISQSIWQASVISKSQNIVWALFIDLDVSNFEPRIQFSIGDKYVTQKLGKVTILDQIEVMEVSYIPNDFLTKALYEKYFDVIIWTKQSVQRMQNAPEFYLDQQFKSRCSMPVNITNQLVCQNITINEFKMQSFEIRIDNLVLIKPLEIPMIRLGKQEGDLVVSVDKISVSGDLDLQLIANGQQFLDVHNISETIDQKTNSSLLHFNHTFPSTFLFGLDNYKNDIALQIVSQPNIILLNTPTFWQTLFVKTLTIFDIFEEEILINQELTQYEVQSLRVRIQSYDLQVQSVKGKRLRYQSPVQFHQPVKVQIWYLDRAQISNTAYLHVKYQIPQQGFEMAKLLQCPIPGNVHETLELLANTSYQMVEAKDSWHLLYEDFYQYQNISFTPFEIPKTSISPVYSSMTSRQIHLKHLSSSSEYIDKNKKSFTLLVSFKILEQDIPNVFECEISHLHVEKQHSSVFGDILWCYFIITYHPEVTALNVSVGVNETNYELQSMDNVQIQLKIVQDYTFKINKEDTQLVLANLTQWLNQFDSQYFWIDRNGFTELILLEQPLEEEFKVPQQSAKINIYKQIGGKIVRIDESNIEFNRDTQPEYVYLDPLETWSRPLVPHIYPSNSIQTLDTSRVSYGPPLLNSSLSMQDLVQVQWPDKIIYQRSTNITNPDASISTLHTCYEYQAIYDQETDEMSLQEELEIDCQTTGNDGVVKIQYAPVKQFNQ